MPKDTSNTVESTAVVKTKSGTKKKSGGSRAKTAYQIFCEANREVVKDEYGLSGRDARDKLNDLWWDAEENPNRGKRPVNKKKSKSPAAI